jgi:hypothetical protein
MGVTRLVVLWAGLASVALGCSCDLAVALALDGGQTRNDGGADGGPDAGNGCSDPGCLAVGDSACDPMGSQQLGACVDIGGGCLKVQTQTLAACPSKDHRCPVGGTSCACLATSCTVGDTVCETDGALGKCVADVPNGCGVVSPTSCGPNQKCTGVSPTATCSCNADPNCQSGAGTYCLPDAGGTLQCDFDGDGCLVTTKVATSCSAPKVCSGGGADAGCACPLPALAVNPLHGEGCLILGKVACEGNNTTNVLKCVGVGVCNVWQRQIGCSAMGLVCGNRAGFASCECGENSSSTFYVDPNQGSDPGTAPFATGKQMPAACRFSKLTTALNRAITPAFPTASTPAMVIATGSPGLGGAVFNQENFPLLVKSFITLTTTEPTIPGNYVVAFNSLTVDSAVTLYESSNFNGFLIQNARNSGSVSAMTTPTSCSGVPANAAQVSNVIVNGKAPFDGGVNFAAALNVTNNCSVTLNQSDLRNSGFGVRLQGLTNSTTVVMNGGNIESSTLGVLATRGTIRLNGANVRDSALEGIRVFPSSGAEVAYSQTAGTVVNNQDGGVVFLPGGTAALSTASITRTEIHSNQKVGILMQAQRTLNLAGVNVHNNTQGGLSAVAFAANQGPTVISTGGEYDLNGDFSNAGTGVNVSGSGALFIADGGSFSQNRGPGVTIGGGSQGVLNSVAINGNNKGQVASNNPGALVVEGATLILNALNNVPSVIANNEFNGLRATNSSVTLSGSGATIDLVNNGAALSSLSRGALLNSTSFIGSNLRVVGNGGDGVEVNNPPINGFGQTVKFVGSLFSGNGKSGIKVNSSAGDPNGNHSLILNTNNFVLNTVHGIDIVANGDVSASFNGNNVTQSGSTGIRLNSTGNSAFTFTGNKVVNNGAGPDIGGLPQKAGGLLLVGTAPNVSKFTFTANEVHHNAANQVVAFSASGASSSVWNLNGNPTACTNTTANIFSCYNSVSTVPSGVEAAGVVVIGGACTVQANGNSWQAASPLLGRDYDVFSGGIIDTNPPGAVCPASPVACPP